MGAKHVLCGRGPQQAHPPALSCGPPAVPPVGHQLGAKKWTARRASFSERPKLRAIKGGKSRGLIVNLLFPTSVIDLINAADASPIPSRRIETRGGVCWWSSWTNRLKSSSGMGQPFSAGPTEAERRCRSQYSEWMSSAPTGRLQAMTRAEETWFSSNAIRPRALPPPQSARRQCNDQPR